MKRRAFITLLGGAAAWPLAARAQQSRPMPVVGFINAGTPDGMSRYTAAFRNALSEADYVDGRSVTVEYHWLEGHYDRLPAVIADLVRRRVAVIVTGGLRRRRRPGQAWSGGRSPGCGPMTNRKPVNLALQGGGAHGAFA